MSVQFTETIARHWMIRTLQSDERTYLDCDEILRAKLAEDCAHAFEVDDEGGPLDDPDHWIWDTAHEVAEAWERRGDDSEGEVSP